MAKSTKYSKIFVSGMLFVLLLTMTVPAQAEVWDELKAYVWKFIVPDGVKQELANRFREEFEEALIDAGCCKVLNRDELDAVLAQRENEELIIAIENIEELSPSIKESLKILPANASVPY